MTALEVCRELVRFDEYRGKVFHDGNAPSLSMIIHEAKKIVEEANDETL